MEVLNGVRCLPRGKRPLFVALGNFDGVHRGHQAIINSTLKKARDYHGFSAAMVFDPHPQVALRPEQGPALLTDIADRAEIMAGLGLDYLIVEPFTAQVSSLSPEQFVRTVLMEKLNVAGVLIGENYSFGKQGSGSCETLVYWGNKLGFSVDTVPLLKVGGKSVSSSKIRSMLLSGAVSEAADLLNYYFFRQGRVIRGYGVGKEMVYPTANITASHRLLWPGRGVYLTAVGNIDSGLYYGLTNIGSRPTFSDYRTSVETHILDFEGSIYNHQIRLCFLQKLRETRHFCSPERLKDQVSKDIEVGRVLLAELFKENKGRSHSLQAGYTVLRSF